MKYSYYYIFIVKFIIITISFKLFKLNIFWINKNVIQSNSAINCVYINEKIDSTEENNRALLKDLKNTIDELDKKIGNWGKN